MGIEWNLACLKCQKYLWLGSQKPEKWKGFQIGMENVQRFLMLHALCSNNIILFNDLSIEQPPWQNEAEEEQWQEDILSRTFCFDSWQQDALVCPSCHKKLELEETNRILQGNLKKSQYLWFCEQTCFNKYIEANRIDVEENPDFRPSLLYDSTKDKLDLPKNTILELNCSNCAKSARIDYLEEEKDKPRDFEYLAHFMAEHLGQDHLLRVDLVDKGDAIEKK